jgi:apolipoprotein N-acyltransferase
LLSLSAGGATAFAFAPYDITVVPFITLAVLFHLWRTGSVGQAFIDGYLFGLGLFGVGVSWLHIGINLFSGINLAGAYLLTFLLVAYLALFPAVTGYLGNCRPVRSDYCFFLALMPSLWALGEWVRSWLFTGFPWLTLGYTQTGGMLSGYGSLVGVFGISFIIAFLAGGLVLLMGKDRKMSLALTMLLVLAASWQLRALQWTDNSGREIEVGLIQGAIPQEIKWLPEYRDLSLERYPELTEPFWGHDLIIWPEAAVPGFLHQFRGYMDGLDRTASHSDSILLVGLPTRDSGNGAKYNSLVLLGAGQQVYNKRHLVPFGEYLPLKPLLQWPLDLLQLPIADFTSSAEDGPPLFHADGFSMGLSICYEAVFGAEFISALPEAQVLVNVSNDAWFGDSASPHQHLQMARMRAIETGRYLLRATNTGISAIINEKGEIAGRTRQFEPDAVATRVPLYTGSTLYVLTGDIPVVTLCLVLLVWVLLFEKRTQKQI